MLEMLCAIPEEIGWVIVGAMGMLALQMFCLLVWQLAIEPLVRLVKNWRATRKEKLVKL